MAAGARPPCEVPPTRMKSHGPGFPRMVPAGPGNWLRSVRRLGIGMRPAPVLAVALVALLAGCAQPAPAAVDAAEAGSARAPKVPWTLDVRQSDCEAITWSVPVTAASLRPYLPEGFEPSPPEGQAAGLDGIDAAATLGFRAVECVHGMGEGVDLRSIQSGQVFTPVVPPSGLRDDRFGARHSYGWDVLVAPDAWRAGAVGWGLPVHDGGALVGPGAQGWIGALAMDKVGSFSIAGRSLTPMATPPAQESRLITLGAQGFALWDTEAANVTVSTGPGLWEVSPESWVATVLGAQSGAALFEYSTFDVPSGAVHWPGQALSPLEEESGGSAVPELPR